MTGFNSFDKLRDILNQHTNKEANKTKKGGLKIRFSHINGGYVFYLK